MSIRNSRGFGMVGFLFISAAMVASLVIVSHRSSQALSQNTMASLMSSRRMFSTSISNAFSNSAICQPAVRLVANGPNHNVSIDLGIIQISAGMAYDPWLVQSIVLSPVSGRPGVTHTLSWNLVQRTFSASAMRASDSIDLNLTLTGTRVNTCSIAGRGGGGGGGGGCVRLGNQTACPVPIIGGGGGGGGGGGSGWTPSNKASFCLGLTGDPDCLTEALAYHPFGPQTQTTQSNDKLIRLREIAYGALLDPAAPVCTGNEGANDILRQPWKNPPEFDLQLWCAALPPPPGGGGGGGGCQPPPAGCNNCVYNVRYLGSGCVCGFNTGGTRAFDWDRPGGFPVGDCSCAPQNAGLMCTYSAPAIGNCGARLAWRCR